MPEIKIEINSCSECPFLHTERVYTSDSFERPEKWTCTKKNQVIDGYVDWADKVQIPDWCPAKV